MADDGRLGISVTHADGRVTRWSFDEVDGRNIPNDLTFSTSIPGGFKDVSCSLLRRLDQDYPDQDLFDDIEVYGAGGRTAWNGRAAQFPRSHGDSFSINPGGVGWAAHLRDDPSFRDVIVDRDFGAWGAWSLTRRGALAGVGTPMGKIQSRVDTGGIVWDSPNEALPAFETSEVWYDAGPGVEIAFVYYKGARSGTTASFESPLLYSGTNIDATTANTGITLDNSLYAVSLATPVRALMLRASTTGAVTPAAGTQQRVTVIGAYGNHGLPTVAITGEPDGVLASDVIAHIVASAAPMLGYTTGAGGSIETTAFPIPHLVYRDPVTAEYAVSDVNKYHLYDWGVYDNQEFFYRQPDPDRLCWEARLGDGAHMNADGLTAEQVINGVIVTYTDPTGVQKTVGPPTGTAGTFDDTSTALQDTSTTNPVNSHGIPAKPDNLTLSFPTTLAGATQIGTVYLAERSLATRRGSLTLTGLVQHPTEGKVPVWRVRAGDWIRVTDLNGENASVQRKITETTYTHGSRSLTATLDNTPAKLDAILSRVGVKSGIMSGGGF